MPTATADKEVRCLIAPITGGSILLAGSVVAEVVEYSDLKLYPEAPSWLLGALDWNGRKTPIVSFAGLSGCAEDEKAAPGNRFLVVKSLSESSISPYLGVLINGLPRLLKVRASSLSKPKQKANYPCVFREVTVDEQRTMIPELDELTRLVEKAVVET